jgi:hypothetical protein
MMFSPTFYTPTRTRIYIINAGTTTCDTMSYWSETYWSSHSATTCTIHSIYRAIPKEWRWFHRFFQRVARITKTLGRRIIVGFRSRHLEIVSLSEWRRAKRKRWLATAKLQTNKEVGTA